MHRYHGQIFLITAILDVNIVYRGFQGKSIVYHGYQTQILHLIHDIRHKYLAKNKFPAVHFSQATPATNLQLEE